MWCCPAHGLPCPCPASLQLTAPSVERKGAVAVAVGHVWIPFLLRFCVGELRGARGPASRGPASKDGLANAAPKGGIWAEGASLAGSDVYGVNTCQPQCAAVAPHNICWITRALLGLPMRCRRRSRSQTCPKSTWKGTDVAWTWLFSSLPLKHKSPRRRGLGERGGDRSAVTADAPASKPKLQPFVPSHVC